MTRRSAIIIHACFVFVFLSVVLPLAAWVAYQTIIPVTQIENVAVTKEVKPGDDVIVSSKVVRLKLCDTVVERTIFDGKSIRYVFEPIKYLSAPGPLGHHAYLQKIPVPVSASPGHARVQIGLSWRCSILNDLIPLTDVISVPFEIRSTHDEPENRKGD